MKSIGLLSDTHSYLDKQVFTYFKDCDEIWHAGDVGNIKVADELAAFKPLRLVCGNIDDHVLRAQYPEYIFTETEGVKILILHIAGAVGKYNAGVRSLVKLHGKPDILVCGHSHILKMVKDPVFGWLYINPGAAGVHGFHTIRTCCRFKLADGVIKDMEVIHLGKRGIISNGQDY